MRSFTTGSSIIQFSSMTLKKFFINGFLIIFSVAAFAQNSNDTLNRTDDKGRKQGYWKKLNEDGVLKYEGTFINDTPTGNFIYYFPDGVVKARSTFYDDGKRSQTTTYHHTGKANVGRILFRAG